MHEPNDRTNRGAAAPVQPIDLLIARANSWLEKHENERREISELQSIPDDIPRFVTGDR